MSSSHSKIAVICQTYLKLMPSKVFVNFVAFSLVNCDPVKLQLTIQIILLSRPDKYILQGPEQKSLCVYSFLAFFPSLCVLFGSMCLIVFQRNELPVCLFGTCMLIINNFSRILPNVFNSNLPKKPICQYEIIFLLVKSSKQ